MKVWLLEIGELSLKKIQNILPKKLGKVIMKKDEQTVFALSSNGLGRWTFNPVIRVQFSVGRPKKEKAINC